MYWGDDVINFILQVDDVTFFVKKRYFSFAQVFITISKYIGNDLTLKVIL